jgi:hypothetical protein
MSIAFGPYTQEKAKQYNDMRKELFNPGIAVTSYISLPSNVSVDDFTDPITLDALESGQVYGFLIENDHWYLAGSLTNINALISIKFRGSSTKNVFIPCKNAMVPVKKLKWVRI